MVNLNIERLNQLHRIILRNDNPNLAAVMKEWGEAIHAIYEKP